MCELMAMSFDAPVSADFSLGAFAARGEENPDGWGLGWYPDQSLAVVKEPLKWGASRYAGFVQSHPTILSRTFLAHVRHKTMGGSPTHADTHPFARELGGRDYGFAHNGTLDGEAWDLPLGPFRPLGGDRLGAVFLPPAGAGRVPRRPARRRGRLALAPRDPGGGQPPGQAQRPVLGRPPPVRLPRRERLEGPELPQSPRPRRPASPLRGPDDGRRGRGRGRQPRLRGRHLPAQPLGLAHLPARRADRLRPGPDSLLQPPRRPLARVRPPGPSWPRPAADAGSHHPAHPAKAATEPAPPSRRSGSGSRSPGPPGRPFPSRSCRRR